MAGMRGLGRVTNVLVNSLSGTLSSAAMGTIVCSFKECSGIQLIAYNASGGTASINVTAGTSSAAALGSSSVPEVFDTTNGFGQPGYYYQQFTGTSVSTRSGTASWNKVTTSWGSGNLAIGGSGTTSVVDFLTSYMADTYDYIAFSSPNPSVMLTAVMYDLTVQRTPVNLSNPGS